MFVAKVIGNVVATQKNESLVGSKLLIVKPIQIIPEQKISGPIIAVDTIGAGIGEVVIVSMGSSARNAAQSGSVADAAVVGIIDSFDVDDRS
ncbi:MAG: ethanolamine utilization protein EutN [Clostridiaceae bacterium BRH_c20a]|nr:MAG: ethanolamine utilization protein EutN [Clostridiaceae bacterium BRH_c20a]